MSVGRLLAQAAATAVLAVLVAAAVVVGVAGWGGPDPWAPASPSATVSGARLELLDGLEGFGAGAGRGAARREPRTVTTLADTGAGSLRSAVASSGGWIMFAPSLRGTIRLASPLTVPSDTVIDGRGADVALAATDALRARQGASVLIDGAERVIVAHLELGAGYDGVRITGASRHVWLDHLASGDVDDEVISLVAGEDDGRAPDRVTLSWLRIVGARRAVLIDGGPRAERPIRVTMHHSLLADGLDRHPLARTARVHAYGNWIAGWGARGTGAGMRIGRDGQLLSEHNVFDDRYGRPAILASDLGASGQVRSEGDVVTGGATIEQRDPDEVFAPPDDASSRVRAGAALRVTLALRAGAASG